MGFDMGSAVPVSEPEWSAAHRGLCLYANRLLAPVAEQAVVQPMKSGKLLKPTFAPDVLQVCLLWPFACVCRGKEPWRFHTVR